MRSEKGFTLIEIVMVIILIGFLAAAALPRFIDMSDSAQEAGTRGVLGGVRGAIGIAYANNALNGHAEFPTNGAQLRASMNDLKIPANPYNNFTGVQIIGAADAAAGANIGWKYGANGAGFPGQFWSAVGGGVAANNF